MVAPHRARRIISNNPNIAEIEDPGNYTNKNANPIKRERNNQIMLLINHILKCGGTSIQKALSDINKTLGIEEGLTKGGYFGSSRIRFIKELESMVARKSIPPYIFSHYTIGVPEVFLRSHKINFCGVTFIRDPIKRTKSHLMHMLRNGNLQLRSNGEIYSIFNPNVRMIDYLENYQTKWLIGFGEDPLRKDPGAAWDKLDSSKGLAHLIKACQGNLVDNFREASNTGRISIFRTEDIKFFYKQYIDLMIYIYSKKPLNKEKIIEAALNKRDNASSKKLKLYMKNISKSNIAESNNTRTFKYSHLGDLYESERFKRSLHHLLETALQRLEWDNKLYKEVSDCSKENPGKNVLFSWEKSI